MVAKALPLLASLGTTAGTAGTAAAATGGIMSTLSTIGTIGSIAGTIMSGVQQKNAADFEAKQIEMNAEMERLRSKQEEANRQTRLNSILAQQMAMTAGRGIQVGSGSDLAISDFSEEEKQREDRIAAADLAYSQSMAKSRASQSRIRGKSALMGSLFSAAGKGFDAYTTAKERSRTGYAKSGNLDIDWKS